MARKGKDLFVMLAERHQSRTGGKARAAEPKAASRRRSGDSLGQSLGQSLGRWVNSTIRTFRGAGGDGATGESRASKARPSKASRGGASLKRGEPQRVPRGLLLPGWLLAAMVVGALGCGFLVGRFTYAGSADEGLQRGRSKVEKPSKLNNGGPGYLDPQDREQVLAENFFVVKIFLHEAEKEAAEALARGLRARGQHTTRIRQFPQNDGSFYCWATLCYVARFSDRDTVLQGLQRFEDELGFQVDPELKSAAK